MSNGDKHSPLANKLMEFARADGVLAITGLQVALIDAAIALDNYVTAARTYSMGEVCLSIGLNCAGWPALLTHRRTLPADS